jgi:hypothetical protein
MQNIEASRRTIQVPQKGKDKEEFPGRTHPPWWMSRAWNWLRLCRDK